MEGVPYLDFNSLYSNGNYIDTQFRQVSNITFNAFYITGRAFGQTGSVNVVFSFASDTPTTNLWHLSTNLTTTVVTLTNSATGLNEYQFYWGILPGTKNTNSVRIKAATLQVSYQ